MLNWLIAAPLCLYREPSPFPRSSFPFFTNIVGLCVFNNPLRFSALYACNDPLFLCV